MSAARLTVVEAGRGDLDAVMAVMTDSFDPAYGEAWTGPQCLALLAMPGVWMSIARLDEEPAGFALGRAVAGEAELMLLAVKRGEQGKGIGFALLDRFAAQAAARGVRTLHLEVREGNPAVKLYNSYGFSEVGRRRNYYTGCDGELYDAITLSKTLTQ